MIKNLAAFLVSLSNISLKCCGIRGENVFKNSTFLDAVEKQTLSFLSACLNETCEESVASSQASFKVQINMFSTQTEDDDDERRGFKL